MFHVPLNASPAHALNAPVTSFVHIYQTASGKGFEHLKPVLQDITTLKDVQGAHGGAYGKLVERDEVVMVTGWDSVQVSYTLRDEDFQFLTYQPAPLDGHQPRPERHSGRQCSQGHFYSTHNQTRSVYYLLQIPGMTENPEQNLETIFSCNIVHYKRAIDSNVLFLYDDGARDVRVAFERRCSRFRGRTC
jgi:hypothetical protein